MEFSGEYRIPASRPVVWDALNDPEVLKGCIDGCESLEKVSDTELKARVKAKVGPVSARFNGMVTLSEIQAPESYVISGQGQGGAAGFVKGSARVTLTEADGETATVLRYESTATVGGKLASVGGRLVQGVANKTADDFFRCLSERVGAPAPEAVAPGPAQPVGEAVPATLPPARVPPAEPPPPLRIPLGPRTITVAAGWSLLLLGGLLALLVV
ncbi:CoxG family protein [Roseospira goensis]|uniref:Carbon monoxide dehydrogenase subunit G n=1 Tax=Roseospira goensis TaxID=391922 RepID=A0A7W6WK12_9PROT|nr:carbon monoxide dehydrogenase subunit G [Roseospira goensis]MBB4285058.1 hypothetical protein [Roseospira goensis]